MKVSFNWLKELVELKPGVTADSVADKLTLAGLEVEGIERRGRDLSGVVIAEVRGARPHPGAEKLSIVRLVAGGAEEEVVCGASNVPGSGGKVAWAAPGASLPGGLKLDRREIRGVVSPGMICSEIELGLIEVGKDKAVDGILILSPDAPAGADLVRHVGLLDEVLEVNVTPNRPDALSHAGIAREVAALFGTSWRLPPPDEISVMPVEQGRGVDVEIRDPVACPRYSARTVIGLRVGPSPLALRVRLAACGVRPISNLVDVTNYVMLETGHPLHAFDFDRLRGAIQIRKAGRGERMTTLDGVDRPLQEGDIVIADDRGAIALAGVMGGADSEVTDATKAVLLETATFDPRSVRRTSKRLGLRSEASHRFERGVDAEGIPHASRRATAMLARLGGGQVMGEGIDRYPSQVVPRRVSLSFAGLTRLAGFEIPLAQAAEKLAAIGLTTEPDGSDKLTTIVPSFRPDVAIEEDLIEEVMRLVGYDRAPARLPRGSGAASPSPETGLDRTRDLLAALGLQEIVSWGFVPRPWLAALGAELADGIVVKNPISADYEVMRTSLLPGLVDAAKRNLSRGIADLGLFEVGPVVRRAPGAKDPPLEPIHAAALLVGRGPGWLKPGEAIDFFDIKQIASELLRGLGVPNLDFVPTRESGILHPGAAAAIQVGGGEQPARLGQLGELNPRLARALGLDSRALYLEVVLDSVASQRRPVHSVPPPRFPSVTRDISFWVDVTIDARQQRALLSQVAEPLLRDLAVLEDYRDPKYVPPGKKGMLWSLTYRADDRTLTDAEVDAAHARVVETLKASPSIVIR